MVKAGVTTSINTKHQCITAMKEYENKSLEVSLFGFCLRLRALCVTVSLVLKHEEKSLHVTSPFHFSPLDNASYYIYRLFSVDFRAVRSVVPLFSRVQELRLEDYQAGRKGPTNPIAAGTGGLFGAATPTSSATTGLFGSSAPNASFSFGQNKSTFGAGEWFEQNLS